MPGAAFTVVTRYDVCRAAGRRGAIHAHFFSNLFGPATGMFRCSAEALGAHDQIN
jgi:hypothetical protein